MYRINLSDLSYGELQELRSKIEEEQEDRRLTKEEIELLEWDQSFTLIERQDYGYGYGCYGPI